MSSITLYTMSQLISLEKSTPIYRTGHLRPPTNLKEKSPHYLPQLLWKYVFPSWTLKPGKPPPWTFQTIRFTSLTNYKWFLKAVLSLSFLFISAEFLKNQATVSMVQLWQNFYGRLIIVCLNCSKNFIFIGSWNFYGPIVVPLYVQTRGRFFDDIAASSKLHASGLQV